MRTFQIILMSLALIATFAAEPRAERAASIDYDFIERPANTPPALQAPANVSLRFLSIKTIDGYRMNAALWQPGNKNPDTTPLLVAVHGSGGSFAKPPISFASPVLAAKGYGVLAINTRQHDEHVNTDNFLDIRRDIEAAVHTARALGYRTLVLYGHSLGNIQIQYYAANNWDADIKAVVLSGMFANLPWKSRTILVQNEDNFRALSEAALKALRENKERDVLAKGMHWINGEDVPITGQHFLTYRSEASSAADGTYWIKRIPRPILMVRDAGDATVLAFEPYMLLSAATSAGSLVPGIKYVLLPNPKDPNPNGHPFLDNQQPLVDAIAGWLAEQRL